MKSDRKRDKIKSEFRPSSLGSPALRILNDDLNKVRKDFANSKLVIEPDPDVSFDEAVIVDQIFNDNDGGNGVLLGLYLYSQVIYPISNNAYAATTDIGVANNITGFLFCLPSDIVLRTCVFEVTVAQALSSVGVGWYDVNRNLVWQTGAVSSASTGVKRAAISPRVEIPNGMYYSCWTTDNVGVNIRGISTVNAGYVNVLNHVAARYGTATGGSAGVLPAVLPALATPSGNQNAICSFLEIDLQ
jgi:hypothetical protein